MFKFVIPTILIGTSVAGFFFVVKPTLDEISIQKSQIASYNQALDNSRSLESVRDKLTKQYDDIDKEDLNKLYKLLPDNIDNVRLAIEISEIAKPYGMELKNIKFDTLGTSGAVSNSGNKNDSKDQPVSADSYGTWNLEFSTKASYADFLSFLRDLESNLRIVDISSVSFSPGTNNSSANSPASTKQTTDLYNYNFKIKTYWLKN